MPCRELTYTGPAMWPELEDWLAGRQDPDQGVEDKVRAILAKVKETGDAALAEYTRSFDCPEFTQAMIRVPAREIEAAAKAVDPGDMDILRQAADNIREYHHAQKRESWWRTRPDGTILGQLVRPVDRVGLYVPGGQGGETPLISSLLMNAIPAQVAGVEDIAIVSPPRKDGTLNPLILAAAHMLDISKVYRVGSAWAVAALAYGTQSIARVDVIAGPGNIFVATAKRLLIGQVGIDMIAGPSEILILADGSSVCRPDWIAADMLSQAEHDAQASALLVTSDPDLGAKVKAELTRQVADLPRSEMAEQSLKDWGAVITVDSLDTGIGLLNLVAPEHLELLVEDPWAMVGKVRHAGAIFMGGNSPEPVGDYFAGPNHVLPTMGTARFSSALGVDDFCKASSLIAASPAFIANHADAIARLARLEELEAHARSVESRKQ